MSEEVYDMCIGSSFSAADAYHISLCTEEFAANSIEHGFNDGKKHSLEARVLIGEDDLYLRLRDDCRRFDLTERYRIINPEDRTRNIGLRIVFASADDVSYSSALSMNNVCFRYSLRRDGGQRKRTREQIKAYKHHQREELQNERFQNSDQQSR